MRSFTPPIHPIVEFIVARIDANALSLVTGAEQEIRAKLLSKDEGDHFLSALRTLLAFAYFASEHLHAAHLGDQLVAIAQEAGPSLSNKEGDAQGVVDSLDVESRHRKAQTFLGGQPGTGTVHGTNGHYVSQDSGIAGGPMARFLLARRSKAGGDSH